MPEDPFDDPSGFLDERTDRSVRRFQEDNGLRPDGWMRPGGETEAALREAVSKLEATMRPAWEEYERKTQSVEGAVEPAQFIRPRPWPGGQSLPPIQVPDGDLPGWGLPDLPIPPPTGPLPPGDRSIFDRIFGPRRDVNPIPPEFREFKDVTPTAGPAIFDDLIVPRRGNEDTQALNDRVGRDFLSIAARYGCRPFEHKGGAREEFENDGAKKEEKYIPPQQKSVDGTGRTTTKGGAYGDVHLTTSLNNRTRHVVLQTVDVVASGAPTARELANAAKILRNGGRDFYVLLFPKLPKGWDYDRDAFADLVRRMLDMVCSEDDRDHPEGDRKLQLDKTVPKR
jgi:peptidoglycan hydrolase-like protein with peptidoglycan-binding domain